MTKLEKNGVLLYNGSSYPLIKCVMRPFYFIALLGNG